MSKVDSLPLKLLGEEAGLHRSSRLPSALAAPFPTHITTALWVLDLWRAGVSPARVSGRDCS